MLPTINLTATDFTSLTDGSGQISSLPGATTTADGSFADLLRSPVMVAIGEPFGEGLPEGGNSLPSLDSPHSSGRWLRNAIPDGESSATNSLNVESSAAELAAAVAGAEERVTDVAERGALPPLIAAIADSQNRRPSGLANSSAPIDGVLEGNDLDAAMPELKGRTVADTASRPLPGAFERPATTSSLSASLDAQLPALPVAEKASVGGNESAGGTPLIQAAPSGSVSHAAMLLANQPVTAAPGQSAGNPVMESVISLPVQDPAWSDSLSERVVFMSGNKIQNAEIRLTPAELGPIRVSVSLDDGATNVTFNAQHASTREAIEAALPRLREMLAEQGLSLGNANVADQGGQPESDRSSSADEGESTRSSAENGVEADLPAALLTEHRAARGLVDTFV